MLIHCDASMELPHQQSYSEWNGLASSPDAKLQACTTNVWWSQFDCEKHSAEQQNTYHIVELLLKRSLTSDPPASAWVDKIRRSDWEGSFKAMWKRGKTWSVCERLHFFPSHLSLCILSIIFECSPGLKAFHSAEEKTGRLSWSSSAGRRTIYFQIIRDLLHQPGFMFFVLLIL